MKGKTFKAQALDHVFFPRDLGSIWGLRMGSMDILEWSEWQRWGKTAAKQKNVGWTNKKTDMIWYIYIDMSYLHKYFCDFQGPWSYSIYRYFKKWLGPDGNAVEHWNQASRGWCGFLGNKKPDPPVGVLIPARMPFISWISVINMYSIPEVWESLLLLEKAFQSFHMDWYL